MTIGLGIIGCGTIADFHARAIAEVRGARLVACYDRIKASADALAEKHGCEAIPDLNQLVRDRRIQVLSICTPSGSHAEPAIAAIEAGKHVLIEKPLEVTLRRCDRILDAAQRQGVVVSTVFQSRFHDAARALKLAVDQERFGTLALASAYVKWFRPQSYYDSGAWRGTWALDGGGALMNQAIHSVDLLLWLIGPVDEVTAQGATTAHDRIEVEDVIVATMRFRSGALGGLEATTASYPGSLKRIEIRGSEGTAALEEESLVDWQFARARRTDAALLQRCRTQTGGGASSPTAIGHHGHAAQIRDVLRAIRTGAPPLIDGPQSRSSVELVLAIYQAAKSRRAVKLPLARDPRLH